MPLLLIPWIATLCIYGAVVTFSVVGFLMASGVSGKNLILEVLLAISLFGIGALLCCLSYIPLRLKSRTASPTISLLAWSLLPPLILFCGLWIEDGLSSDPSSSAAPVIVGIGSLLLAFAVETWIVQRLCPLRNNTRDGEPRNAVSLYCRPIRFFAIAILLFIPVRLILVLGMGSSRFDGLALSGLLVLAPMRFLVVRSIRNRTGDTVQS